jgi:hypothetical protein
MLRIIPVLLLSGLLGAARAEKPKLSAVWLREQRNKSLAKYTSIGGYERLEVRLQLEGLKGVRSYGDLKVTEAKADTGADLIRRPKDRGAFFAVTGMPYFRVVPDYQAKSGTAEVEVILHKAPRGAKKVSLKGGLDVLTGGEPTHIDFANFRDVEALKDNALTAAGLKISKSKEKTANTDTQLTYSIEGDNSTLLEISLIDASGKKIKTSGGYYYSRSPFRGGGSYSLTSSQKIPKDAKLRVTLIKGGNRTMLPFAYDLELP